MNKYLLSTLILLIFVSIAYTEEDSLSFATYYPAPYGNYREMRVMRMAIGDNYIKNNDYSWETGATNLINSNVDLVVEGNVGIGTVTPRIPATGPATGNLDVNDIWIRNTSTWLSQRLPLECTTVSGEGTYPTVSCPAGYTVTGGGGHCDDGSSYIQESDMVGNGWKTGCASGGYQYPGNVFAVCCK